jgi:CubicO group peptidase (beta-lactamase class C family)
MPFRRILILIAVLWLAAPSSARADQADDFVQSQMKMFHLHGISVAVVKNGQIIKAQGYGVADDEGRTPAQTDTVYKIGSVSKQFIATGIMLLVRDGRVGLDDPIGKFIEGTPAAWTPITVRHLMTHTAGLLRESPGFDANKVISDADVLKAAYRAPLLFTPGQKYEYSNVGYYALAEIIRIASGRPWQEYIEEKVFQPAGLSIVPTNTRNPIANKARGYDGRHNTNLAADWVALRPSGAFLSTVLDLAKWDAVLYTDRVLTDAERQQMYAPARLNDGTTAAYGFGWHVESRNGRRFVWHGGGMPGFSSQFVRYIDDGISVITLTNGTDVDSGAIANGLARMYLPAPAPKP